MKNDFFDKLGYTIKNGLVHNLDEAQNNVERLYIEEVKKLNVPADAVFFRRFYQTTGWTFRGIQADITRSHGEDGKRKDRKRTRDWNGKFNFPFWS